MSKLEDTEKAIQESYDLLCGKSNLPKDEILSRMNDETWKNICVDMAECKRAIMESKFHETNDIDNTWIQFKEHLQRKQRRRIWIRTAGWAGLVATICFLVFLIGRLETDSPKEKKYFCASGSPHEITLKICNDTPITLEDAVRKGHLEKTDALKKKEGKDDAFHRSISSNTTPEWHCISIPRGKDFVLVLSDGTKVWLNAESQLEYPTMFTETTRTVRLSGEAYFDVASDAERPFIVQAGMIHTRVLGTEFNVRNYDNENPSITLVEGQVEVGNLKTKETILLHPNENLRLLDNGNFEKQTIDVNTHVSWTKGLFYFDNVSLDKIIYELGRWYDVDIHIGDESLLKYKLHYYCSRTDNLHKALQFLSDLGRFQITYENQAVIIR